MRSIVLRKSTLARTASLLAAAVLGGLVAVGAGALLDVYDGDNQTASTTTTADRVVLDRLGPAAP